MTGSRRSTPSCNDAVSANCSDSNAAGSVVAGSGWPRMMAVVRGAKASVVTARFAASAGSPNSMRPAKRPGTSANSKRPSAALATPDAPSYVACPSVPASSAPASGKGSPPSQPRNFECRSLVLPGRGVDAALSFHRKVGRIGSEDAAGLQVEGKPLAGLDVIRRERDAGELLRAIPRRGPGSRPCRARARGRRCASGPAPRQAQPSPGTGSPPSFDQFAVPSGFTTSRTVASETEIVSTSEMLKISDQGMRRRSCADRHERARRRIRAAARSRVRRS